MADVLGRRQYSTRSGRIITNVLPAIILIDENINDAAFLAFFNKVPKMNTAAEEFKWDVDEFLTTNDTVDGAVAGTTATTIGVDNPSRFNVGQTWINKRTGEIMAITAVNTSTKNITVTRAISALSSGGGTAAAAINDADTLVMLAPAVGETNSRQVTQTTTPSEVTNYCQQFRWDLSLSQRQIKRAYDSGDELPYQTKKQMKEAQMALNRAFLKGEKGRYTDADGQDVTLTEGMAQVPSTYTWAVSGTMYEYAFDEFLVESALRKGSRNKVMFASTQVILALSEMSKDRVEYNLPMGTHKKPVGISVMEYMAPNGGTLTVVEDRFLSENFNGEAYICDMTQLKRRTFTRNGQDGDLHVISDTADPDDLGQVSTIAGDMGLQYGSEKVHAKISGVTGGAKGLAVL
jgi:hypothetical protein